MNADQPPATPPLTAAEIETARAYLYAVPINPDALDTDRLIAQRLLVTLDECEARALARYIPERDEAGFLDADRDRAARDALPSVREWSAEHGIPITEHDPSPDILRPPPFADDVALPSAERMDPALAQAIFDIDNFADAED